MSLSMHDACVPGFVRMFGNLTSILEKAEAFAEARKIDPAVLIQSRLAPDMFALARQVQICSDTAKGAVARLTGTENPRYEDKEASFAELKARIAKTVAFIESVPAAGFEGAEARDVVLKLAGNEVHFTGTSYLFHFALPNFQFHATAIYLILRHNGVEVGKMDFLGRELPPGAHV
ncbi:MAG TPA: DUF1993 domain-containing protein [Roseomonas sp.]|jgi:hypothetical protein